MNKQPSGSPHAHQSWRTTILEDVYSYWSFNFLNSYPSLVLSSHNFHGQHTLASLAHAVHCLLCHLDVDSLRVYICRQMCPLFETSFRVCFLGNSFCIQALFSLFTVSSCHLPAPLIVLKKTICCISFPTSLPTPLLLLQLTVYGKPS